MRLAPQISYLFILVSFFTIAHATDWSQPPLGCIEEMIQQPSLYPCPDLTLVEDPSLDFPSHFTPEETALWSGPRAKAMLQCRSEEILRRETVKPGSFSGITLERAWMRVEGAKDHLTKADTIYDASARFGVPPHILLGALMQESLMADLGISDDGGNFSCGVAQLNVLEWCRWAEKQSTNMHTLLGWPRDLVNAYKEKNGLNTVCNSPVLETTHVRPFYQYGLRHLQGTPAYQMNPSHMADIELKDVLPALPAASAETQNLRFHVTRAFTQNCSSFATAILAKGHELSELFQWTVPAELQSVQRYSEGDTFQRSCRKPYPAKVHPLHAGWLLADAVYNAGSRIVNATAWYLQLTPDTFHSEKSWSDFYPQNLISALYWSGKYNPATDYLDFEDFNGNKLRQTFYKSCIVQRHVARVVQYVTLPGYNLAQSLEDKNGCRKSVFNSDGSLQKSNVPLERQRSSGRKDRVVN